MGLELGWRVLDTYDLCDLAPNDLFDALQSLHLLDQVKQFSAGSDKDLCPQVNLDLANSSRNEDNLPKFQ